MGVDSECLAAALAYAGRGWRVIPCAARGKAPLTAHGPKDSTVDQRTIREWWARWPNANVGAVAGVESDFFVLDVDGPAGEDSLVGLAREHGKLPSTIETQTGGGGRHLFFKHPGSPVRNSAGKIGKGLDVRGDGGYVIAPPSIHESGKVYTWAAGHTPDDLSVAGPPVWMINLIQPKERVQRRSQLAVSEGYAEAALARELVALARAAEGTRNDHLCRSAFSLGQLVGCGALNRSLVERSLHAQATEIGLGEIEIRATIRSGLEKGMSQPREMLGPEEGEVRQHRTDVGNAKRLVSQHGQDIRYCPPWDKWLVWDGTRWLTDETGEVVRRAKDTARLIYMEAAAAVEPEDRKALAKWAARSEFESRLRAMISLAKSEPRIAVLPHELDAEPWLLNSRNGTIDLRSGELRPHRREDLCTKQVPVEYDPNASCSVWNEFLGEIMGYDLPLVSFLQRAVGYALTGDTGEQVLFLLYGTGANGKSTFLETIKALLGDYAKQASFDTFLARKNDAVRNDVARLAGARFVPAIEAEAGKRLSEVLVKSVTGGDTVAARFLYGEFFEFHPQFKLFLAANHKPVIKGTDNAIWRRIRLVPFAVTIPLERQDKQLPEKLRAEMPGILAWAVRGCLVWQRDGLEAPEQVQAATESYRDEMDVLGDFLEELCTQHPAVQVEKGRLYKEYTEWCATNGEYPIGKRNFGMRLAERGFQSCKGTHGVRIWRGIGLVARVTEGGASSAKVTHEGGHRGLSQEDRHLVPHRPPVSSDSEPEGVGSLL